MTHPRDHSIMTLIPCGHVLGIKTCSRNFRDNHAYFLSLNFTFLTMLHKIMSISLAYPLWAMIPRNLMMDEYLVTHAGFHWACSVSGPFAAAERSGCSCADGRISLSSLCVLRLIPFSFENSTRSFQIVSFRI